MLFTGASLSNVGSPIIVLLGRGPNGSPLKKALPPLFVGKLSLTKGALDKVRNLSLFEFYRCLFQANSHFSSIQELCTWMEEKTNDYQVRIIAEIFLPYTWLDKLTFVQALTVSALFLIKHHARHLLALASESNSSTPECDRGEVNIEESMTGVPGSSQLNAPCTGKLLAHFHQVSRRSVTCYRPSGQLRVLRCLFPMLHIFFFSPDSVKPPWTLRSAQQQRQLSRFDGFCDTNWRDYQYCEEFSDSHPNFFPNQHRIP